MSNDQYAMTNGIDRRRGVALIIVLGFLSIMIVMAVAFLTQARVERQVADSTLEAMRGRQLLRTAVYAAMNDYSVELANSGLVMPPTNSDYDVFVSVPPAANFGLAGRKIGQDNVDLLVGEVESWIPQRYYTNAPYYARDTVTNEAQWILVREDPTTAQPSRILGRYAYVCFDQSGGIDANLIARDPNVAGSDGRTASNRVRRSARQVPMNLLPETVDASQFKSYRAGWKGFDSLYALIKLTDGYPNDGNLNSCVRWQPERKECVPGPGLASNLVSDLVPFSLSVYRGGRFDSGTSTWTPPVLCGGAPWDNVLNPITGQFAGNWKEWIEDAINDYTNKNSKIPAGVDYPSPKNVPMFNEINATCRLFEIPTVDPQWSTYELEVRLTFEFWYPFPSDDNKNPGNFQMPAPTVGGNPLATGPDQVWLKTTLQVPAFPAGFPVGLLAGVSPGALSVEADYNKGKPYTPAGSSNFAYRLPVNPMPAAGYPGAPAPNLLPSTVSIPGLQLKVENITISHPIYLTGAGGNADMISEGLLLSPTPMMLVPGAAAPVPRVLEVTDPRLNHLPGQWVLQPSPSLNAQNKWDAAMEAKFLAEGTNMYCRNGPMVTPAELGFISTGKAWETIDICTPAAAGKSFNNLGVLDRLVADTNLYASWVSNKVFYTNGTINLNTRSSNVLAACFVDLTRHEVPGVAVDGPDGISANPIEPEVAFELAKSILAANTTGKLGQGAFETGTDWVRCDAMQQGGSLAAMGLNNNQREALVRNTWGLFSPDNSLFTVVAVAQAIKEAPASVDPVGVFNENFDMITGERRAVVLVWRDPFKNGGNLHHEMFPRMFRYLND